MKDLSQIIEQYQQNNQFSGQIVIARKNAIIHSYITGFADFASKKPFSQPQIFPVASLTKQFMAVAILKLVAAGKIELHKPISQYLVERHEIWDGAMPQWANEITIHQLLSNSSGLVNYVMEAIFHPDEWRDLDDANGCNIVRQIVGKIKSMPLLFTPGSQFGYSNTNYLLLGEIAGAFLSDLTVWFKQEIFQPLKMNDTTWPALDDELAYVRNIYTRDDLPKRYTSNYHQIETVPELVTSHGFNVPCSGAGGMFSTAHDLLIWNSALYNGKVIDNEQLLQMTTIHQQIEDDPSLGKVAYGYGLMIDEIGGYKIYRHSGHFSGIRTQLSYDPRNQISIILLTNISPSYAQDFSLVALQDKEQVDLVSQLHLAVIA